MLILTLCVVLCKKHVLPTQKKIIQQSKSTIMTVLKGVDDIYDLRVNFIMQCWILHAICIWSFQYSFSERGSWLPPQVQMWCIYAEGAPWAPLLLPLIDRLCDLNGLFACVRIHFVNVPIHRMCASHLWLWHCASKVENDKMLLDFKKPSA